MRKYSQMLDKHKSLTVDLSAYRRRARMKVCFINETAENRYRIGDGGFVVLLKKCS